MLDIIKLENIFIELRTEFQNYHNGLLNKKRQIAPDFNAFEILYALELPLSRMIGEFLNPEGRHSQGRNFLDLFIETFIYHLKKLRK
jgi:PD-(D/E)XK nuclease superfamily